MRVFTDRPAIGFSCDRLPTQTGYTWTLTTQLGALLREAQDRFGPRDKQWTILGIEYSGDIPHVWYPGNCGHVSVMLTDSARQNTRRALFQLAHEVIHLLAPTGTKVAPVVEEGLATIFADEISARHNLHFNSNDVPSYVAAAAATRQLLAIDPSAIRTVRAKEPNFCRFTPELILGAYPSVDKGLAQLLCERFSRNAKTAA